jgi:putative membrane protein
VRHKLRESELQPGALPTVAQRLSPLSPIVRIGRSFLGVILVLAAGRFGSGQSHSQNRVVDLVVVGVAVVFGIVSWAVTTWWIDGDTLQVATGLIRRNTARVPLSRVQAVDLVEPLIARVLGLAEVRVRTAGGSGGDARLMYLKLDDANWVRASLLAMAHGLPDSTPPPPERSLFQVSNGRLVGSILLTAPALMAVIPLVVAVSLLATGTVTSTELGAASGTLLLDVVTLVSRMVRRVASEWGFEVAEAPDGLRIRSGLASRVAETIPYGRVQAVRMEEPLWWRPFGWCRLELHLAGSVRREHDQPRSAIRRALLPVGSRSEAEWLLGRILPEHRVPLTPPPRRAVWRAPFNYHFLAAGRNQACAVSTSGRVRRLTEWVPLAKVQSVRYEQGPLQRPLGLASVRLDVAGRRASVRWWNRSAAEADDLMRALPLECETARDLETAYRRQLAPAHSAPAGSGSVGSMPAVSMPAAPAGPVPAGPVPAPGSTLRPGTMPAAQPATPAGPVPVDPVPADAMPAGPVPAGPVPAPGSTLRPGTMPAAQPAGPVPAAQADAMPEASMPPPSGSPVDLGSQAGAPPVDLGSQAGAPPVGHVPPTA